MSLSFAAEPVGARAALSDGLNALRITPTPAATAHLAAAGGGAQAPPPLPVHFFQLDDLAANKDPRNSTPVSWAYLVVANKQAVRTAEIVSDKKGGYAFAAISAAHATETAEAIRIAENAPAIAAGDYELRIARIPALYLNVLWLKDKKGSDDYFMVIPPSPQGFQSHTLNKAADFLKLLQASATQKLQVTPAKSQASPTN